MPLEVFENLGENDILFVDSSHISKANSDVNLIIFEILPRLKKGVYVHFHDIIYPFEYPKEWLEQKRAWNEIYILRSFLECNPAFEIVFFNSCMWHLYKEEFISYFPQVSYAGVGLWIRKV